MIHSGATPMEAQTVLGHAIASFTLTVYGHILDADLDRVAERLDAVIGEPETGQGRDKTGRNFVQLRSTATG